MSRVIALSIIALSLAIADERAFAEEGPAGDVPLVPEENRVASYTRVPAPDIFADGSPALETEKRARHSYSKASPATGKTPRAVTLSKGSRYFTIHSAVSTLRADRDADRHHSEFRVRFDADVQFGDALVYARLYLRRAGESEWFLYHRTNDFWIYGQSGNDAYYVTTILDAGYATAEYDVLIDLYESGSAGIVATLGPRESGALSRLPLEEVGLDVPIQLSGYSIGEVVTELIVDDDRDGFYSRFRITFDPDADYDSRLVYARIWVRARGGEWIQEYVTEDWFVDISGSRDAYQLDIDWISGYPTSYYDVQIDLYDSATDLLVASAGSDRADLAQIPLEDRTRDRRQSSPSPGSGGDVSSREGGGGSFELWSLLGLVALATVRRFDRI